VLNNARGKTIGGGAGGPGASGGAGVANAGTLGVTKGGGAFGGLSNSGQILGGAGGSSSGAGGAGVANSGTIVAVTNSGAIKGGQAARGATGAPGGAGLSNSGTILTVINNGTIAGGQGGLAGGQGARGGSGGAGVLNNGGTITTLTNKGAVSGGAGGAGAQGGSGGAGISNTGTITTLTNTGTISGGAGGAGSIAGVSGAGVNNGGTITTLTNSGTITGVVGVINTNTIGVINNLASGQILGAQMGILNKGTLGPVNNAGLIDPPAGAAAIFSTGSIGPITNTGQIVGNVEIDNQASVTVNGGRGKFGSWTGGVITIGNGSLTFASGKTALSDNIVVNFGANGAPGTVFNNGALMLGAPQTITGNFAQSAPGALDFGLAGDMTGQYGSLAVSGLASLGGGLGLDLTNGFTLAAGDTFDNLMTLGAVSGFFTTVSVDGAGCSARSGDVWFCRKEGVNLDFSFMPGVTGAALDLTVASGAAAAAKAIPEPSTWAMLALGFLGLGGLGLKGRRKAAMAEKL
jgi:hypothetical protein